MPKPSTTEGKGRFFSPFLSIIRGILAVWDGLIMDQSEAGVQRRARLIYSILTIGAIGALIASPGGTRQAKAILSVIGLYGGLIWCICFGIRQLRAWEKEQKRKSNKFGA